jgi:hypothetical protein
MALDHISPLLAIDSLESLQSILCCAVYSIRSPVGASLWCYLLPYHKRSSINRLRRKISGMSIQNCIELGYHRSAEIYRRDADTLAKELSKRCFWVAYDIDRVAAFRLGRPVGIPEEAIDVEVCDRAQHSIFTYLC